MSRPKDRLTRTGELLYIPVFRIGQFFAWQIINKKYFYSDEFNKVEKYTLEAKAER